ncbi:hypothetical protein [Allohahella sp. A8]|uniref:hypothetical protein n=1 Tax=Allohahella sp. A8 TaxID=3141461 RepID=UPI00268105C5
MEISKVMARFMTLLTAAVFTVGLSACDTDGPAENAGESMDNAATDTGNAIEDACENVKEGAGADDTDC